MADGDSCCEYDQQIAPGRPPAYQSRCGWPGSHEGCGATYLEAISPTAEGGRAHCIKCGRRAVVNMVPDAHQPPWAAEVIRNSGVGVRPWLQMRERWTRRSGQAAGRGGRAGSGAAPPPDLSDSEDEEVLDWLEDAVSGSRLHAPASLGGRVALGRVVRALAILWEEDY
eukprot:TRINITY_DN56820_c0_g1_i1.p1 TRINITY_DN56820_c0_g1~~TRINITY_DN56820_c0_g1_i1.p1  ORF type:complete len:169 (+),score=25.90 TRINITY_DN56820_c0_g1_i1:248-754(+)